MANPNFIPNFSTNEIFRDLDNSRCLTDDLDNIESDISSLESGKASLNHEHSGYAASDHEHSGYATVIHTHSEYAASNHEHSDYAAVSHIHSEYASASHGHSGYASSDHNHDSDYASISHSHSNYASSTHDHDADYLPANGDVNVDGVLRVKSQQSFYYDTTSNSQTIGTNNASGGTNITCGSSATVSVAGALVKTPTLVPRATDTFYCGNANFRWKGIYSTSAVNVSSDERLKRNIQPLDNNALAEFVDKLKVVSYNYNSDAVDEKTRIGLIAQDVQKADMNLSKFFVSEDENGMLNLTPADFVFALIASVQQLKEEIRELKER